MQSLTYQSKENETNITILLQKRTDKAENKFSLNKKI